MSSPASGGTNGGVSNPAQGDSTLTDPSARIVVPPRPSRVSSFNRVTTGRSEVVSTPSQARRAAGPVGSSVAAGKISPSAAIGPYRARAIQAQAEAAKDRAPTSSSWHEAPEPPTSPPPAAVRSTAHNYYPGMRPGLQPNANTPQAARTGQRRTGMPGGALSGLGAGAAKVARPAPTLARTPPRR